MPADSVLRAGALVRVQATSFRRDQIVGTIVLLSRDTLTIEHRSNSRVTVWPVPYAAIERLEIATGRRRAATAFLGAAAFGVLAGTYTRAQQGTRSCEPECQGSDLDIAVTSLVGAIVGGALGAWVLAPRVWQTVPVSGR